MNYREGKFSLPEDPEKERIANENLMRFKENQSEIATEDISLASSNEVMEMNANELRQAIHAEINTVYNHDSFSVPVDSLSKYSAREVANDLADVIETKYLGRLADVVEILRHEDTKVSGKRHLIEETIEVLETNQVKRTGGDRRKHPRNYGDSTEERKVA